MKEHVHAAILAGGLLLLGCEPGRVPLFESKGQRCALDEDVKDKAKSADDFVDFIGVQVRLSHEAYLNTPLLKSKVEELGVRHMLDESTTNLLTAKAFAGSGVSTELWMHEADDPAELSIGQAGSLTAFHFGFSWGDRYDSAGIEVVRNGTREIYRRVKAKPESQSLAVVGPAIDPARAELVGDLSEWVDFGTAHLDFEGLPPVEVPFAQAIEGAARTYKRKPLVVPRIRLVPPAQQQEDRTKELQQAKHLARTLLELFNAGIARAFIYQLTDGDPFTTYNGLVRRDGSVKPAFNVVKNLIARLRDPGPPLTDLQAFPFSLVASKTVHHVLMQNRAGRFFLALWREAPANEAGMSELVKVSLSAPAREVVTYRPSQIMDMTGRGAGEATFTVEVDDDVTLLEIASGCP